MILWDQPILHLGAPLPEGYAIYQTDEHDGVGGGYLALVGPDRTRLATGGARDWHGLQMFAAGHARGRAGDG